MEELTQLVHSADRLTLGNVPATVQRHAALVLADTIGVIMAGTLRDEVATFIRGDGELFEAPSGPFASEVLSPGLPKSSPETAAFINGTAWTFLELDEGYRPTGHPAVHVLPAALAAAQHLHRTGAELLEAFILGYEVTARLFEAFRLRYPVHPHGHLGAIGAAVAVARLRRVEPAKAALVASSLPLLGVWDACFDGATARNAYAGTAASMGIRANRLAAAGFTGSQQALPVTFGAIIGSLAAKTALSDAVDPASPRILNDYLKVHSACALTRCSARPQTRSWCSARRGGRDGAEQP